MRRTIHKWRKKRLPLTLFGLASLLLLRKMITFFETPSNSQLLEVWRNLDQINEENPIARETRYDLSEDKNRNDF